MTGIYSDLADVVRILQAWKKPTLFVAVAHTDEDEEMVEEEVVAEAVVAVAAVVVVVATFRYSMMIQPLYRDRTRASQTRRTSRWP